MQNGEDGHDRRRTQEPVRGLVLEFGGLGGTTIAVRRTLAVIGLFDLAVITTSHSWIVPRRSKQGQQDRARFALNNREKGVIC